VFELIYFTKYIHTFFIVFLQKTQQYDDVMSWLSNKEYDKNKLTISSSKNWLTAECLSTGSLFGSSHHADMHL